MWRAAAWRAVSNPVGAGRGTAQARATRSPSPPRCPRRGNAGAGARGAHDNAGPYPRARKALGSCRCRTCALPPLAPALSDRRRQAKDDRSARFCNGADLQRVRSLSDPWPRAPSPDCAVVTRMVDGIGPVGAGPLRPNVCRRCVRHYICKRPATTDVTHVH